MMDKLNENNVTQLDSWHHIDWKKVNANLKNLRQRIFVASRNKDHKKVKNLQKLMLSDHQWNCLSRVLGNLQARFLGGKGAARLPTYPTSRSTICSAVPLGTKLLVYLVPRQFNEKPDR